MHRDQVIPDKNGGADRVVPVDNGAHRYIPGEVVPLPHPLITVSC